MKHLVYVVILSNYVLHQVYVFMIFEMEAKLSRGLDACPTSHVPNLRSRR